MKARSVITCVAAVRALAVDFKKCCMRKQRFEKSMGDYFF